MATLFALLAGAVFGIGLIVSGMANPAKVLGFLDLAGPWDPSLAFVMAGAILVGAVAFMFARRRTQSLLGLQMRMPTATQARPPAAGRQPAVRHRVGHCGLLPRPGARRPRHGRAEGTGLRRRDARRHGAVRAVRAPRRGADRECVTDGLNRKIGHKPSGCWKAAPLRCCKDTGAGVPEPGRTAGTILGRCCARSRQRSPSIHRAAGFRTSHPTLRHGWLAAASTTAC